MLSLGGVFLCLKLLEKRMLVFYDNLLLCIPFFSYTRVTLRALSTARFMSDGKYVNKRKGKGYPKVYFIPSQQLKKGES